MQKRPFLVPYNQLKISVQILHPYVADEYYRVAFSNQKMMFLIYRWTE